MVELSPRAGAALSVAEVLEGRSLTDSLAFVHELVAEDRRALASELAYGACRFWHRLLPVVTKLLQKKLRTKDSEILALLVIGLYQMGFTRIPAHAAISETAEAARALGKPWAVGLVNALLRRFQREGEQLLAEADKDWAVQQSQPDWLFQRIKKAWPEHWRQLMAAMQQRPLFTLRVNLSRTNLPDYLALLSAAGIVAQVVDAVPSALILDHALQVEMLPGFADGLVSVQDAGAQLAAQLLAPEDGDWVLDACAAPGGKTAHLLEMARVHMTALDVDEVRLELVVANLSRLGLGAEVIAADAAIAEGSWSQHQYKRILLDAPCSATGVMRRHPDIKMLRRETDIAQLVQRQYDLLSHLWRLLEPGGRLLYATCSLLPDENDMQIERMLKETADAVLIRPQGVPGVQTAYGLQTLPGVLDMDGFYYALLEKRSL